MFLSYDTLYLYIVSRIMSRVNLFERRRFLSPRWVIDDDQTIVLRDYFLFTAFTWALVQDWIIDCTCCCARELKIHKRKLQVNKRKVARLVDLISG